MFRSIVQRVPILSRIGRFLDDLLSSGKDKVIIDCDPGVDDMEALLLAMSSKNTKILAITTVAGNGSADRVYKNAHKIMKFKNSYDIPVFKSSDLNMHGRKIVTDNYFGHDAMGEIDLPDHETKEVENLYSSEVINHYTRMYPGEVTIIALGPLTNLAVAYITDNNLPKRLGGLYVLGGDRRAKNGGNVTPHAEFNVWCDPLSWSIVMTNFKLENSKKIVLVDFDFCTRFTLPLEFVQKYYQHGELLETKSPHAKLVNKTYNFMKKKFQENGLVTADPFIVYLALFGDPDLEGVTCNVCEVILYGEEVGRTVFEYCNDGNITLVDGLNFERFKSILWNSINI